MKKKHNFRKKILIFACVIVAMVSCLAMSVGATSQEQGDFSTVTNTLSDVATALFGANGAIPTFWNWLTSTTVLPFFLVGVAVSLLLLAVRIVKGIFWGV